jgi:Holliday junction DNA helicase RuvA
MFEYIKGSLEEIGVDYVVVDTAGVGYKLYIPLGQYKIPYKIGDFVKFYVCPVYREDSEKLFGFIQKRERDLFIKLGDVSGIGPKTALSLLSHHSMDQILFSIQSSNSLLLATTPGIGKKTAEKLVIDLKDKIAHLSLNIEISPGELNHEEGILRDATQALVRLGYSPQKSRDALQKALDQNPEASLGLLITQALKQI